MTFKEKLKSEYTDLTNSGQERIIEDSCPYEFGYEKSTDVDCEEQGHDCKKCWNREMPNTELVKTVTLPMPPNTGTKKNIKIDKCLEEMWYDKGFEDGMSEGLTQGQNDVWELAKKYEKMSIAERKRIFGVYSIWDILNLFNPQEALAKLKAYEETQSKIEVGDVVLMHRQEAVVTRVVHQHANILFGDGVTNNVPVKDLVGNKTGKHLDIQSILEQIGE